MPFVRSHHHGPRRRLAALLAVASIGLAPVASMADENRSAADDLGGQAFDLLILRPASLLKAAFGVGYLVAATPFALPSGNLGQVTDRLVVDPAKDTFRRDLGDF